RQAQQPRPEGIVAGAKDVFSRATGGVSWDWQAARDANSKPSNTVESTMQKARDVINGTALGGFMDPLIGLFGGSPSDILSLFGLDSSGGFSMDTLFNRNGLGK